MQIVALPRTVVVALGLVLLAPVAGSAADEQVGASFTPEAGSCSSEFTALQTTSGTDRTAVVEADGVVTSWTFTAAPSSPPGEVVGLRIGRPSAAPSGFDIAGASAEVVQVPGQATTSTTRVPVRSGDVMGLYYNGEGGCVRQADGDYLVRFALLDQTSGPFDPQDSAQGYELGIQATVEPDADADGFGDTTQDRCSTQADTQGACRDLIAPTTTITSVKAARVRAAQQGTTAGKSGKAKRSKKATRAKVTVTFSADEAATFRCSVDGAPAQACVSPLVTRLKKGRHAVAVTAVDAAGNADATPATASVKVKKARRR